MELLGYFQHSNGDEDLDAPEKGRIGWLPGTPVNVVIASYSRLPLRVLVAQADGPAPCLHYNLVRPILLRLCGGPDPE